MAMCGKKIIALLLIFSVLTVYIPILSSAEDESTALFSIIEAENCSMSGFKVENNANASGVKSVVSYGANTSLTCETPQTDADMYLWIRAFGDDSSTKLTAKINGRSYEINNIYSAGWGWQRIKLNGSDGKLILTASGKNVHIDQLLFTSDGNFKAEGIVSADSETKSDNTYPENKEALKSKFPEMRENNGSYFAEAEDAQLNAPMTVVEGETASGGKYAVVQSGQFLEPYSVPNPHIGLKFNVKEKGTYYVWVRYFTPKANQKSSWVSIDGKDYYRLDTKITADWTWAKTNTVSLAEGWHTLDIKARQSGHRLDCFVITNDSKFTPSGRGSLPGEEERPSLMAKAERIIPRIHLNGETVVSSAVGKMVNGIPVVPIRNFCEKLGAGYYIGEDYAVIYRERQYLKIIKDSDTAVLNGEKIQLRAPSERNMDEFLTDFDAVAKLLDLEYTVDEENQIICEYTFPDDIKWEDAENETRIEISTEPSSMWIDYAYAAESGYDAAYAWIRRDGERIWKKGYDPVYEDGKICGGFSSLNELTKYTMKLVIIRNGSAQTIYKSWKNSHQEQKPNTNSVYNFVYHGDGLILKQTYENISCYLDYENENAECKTYYREKGTEEWQEAFGLYKDFKIKQFRGSIVGFTPGKAYEIKAVVTEGGKEKEYISETEMWSDNPPIAKEYKLSDLYDKNKNEGAFPIQYLKGTPDGWIKIKGTEGDNTIEASKNVDEAVWVSNCEYVIFEDLVVKGGYYHGFHVVNRSNNVRINNCDISGYGVPGIRNEKSGMFCDYKGSSNNPNQNSGVRITDTECITVENCYIHDPSGRTNAWKYAHPAGMNAVSMRSGGRTVIRNNDFIGNEWNRWNDAIEAFYNPHRSGGPARDCDIYGNVLMIGQDDGMELDGAQMNARVYNNMFQGSLCSISTIPQFVGPSYVFKNMFLNLGTEDDAYGAVVKGGSFEKDGDVNAGAWAKLYLFNNTMCTRGNGISCNYGVETDYRVMSRNNIICISSDKNAINDKYKLDSCDFDYDLISAIDGGQTPGVVAADSAEKHSVKNSPGFTDRINGRLDLSANSAGIDKGEDLKDFTKGYVGTAPDMGALEYGSGNCIYPVRNTNISTDKQMVFFKKGDKEKSFEITLDASSENERIKIDLTEFDKNWISVTDENGNSEFEIKSGEPAKIIVKIDENKLFSYGLPTKKGMAGIRLKPENGSSVVVTVYYREDGKI